MKKEFNNVIIDNILEIREEGGSIINNKIRKDMQDILYTRRQAYNRFIHSIKAVPFEHKNRIIHNVQEYAECINSEHSEYERIYYRTGFLDAISFIVNCINNQ